MRQIVRSLALSGCLIVFGGCATPAPGTTPAPGSVLKPLPASQAPAGEDSILRDFGAVRTGEVLSHDFIIRNDSDKDMNITGTTTSCGCTVSEIKKSLLKPGESTKVTVKLDTKGYTGAVQQFVYVNIDSLDKPVIRLTVKARVE
ncbi:MAG: DUF1573 domain-containing protein [Candidatus Omnitrophica bacterium]|jgi:hypothetical protein|nr:DUF1573 domain-containing protein [Candidatus Omnitrophota bacterium]